MFGEAPTTQPSTPLSNIPTPLLVGAGIGYLVKGILGAAIGAGLAYYLTRSSEQKAGLPAGMQFPEINF